MQQVTILLNTKSVRFSALQKTKANSKNSWSVDVATIDTKTYDLSAKNPNKKEEAALLQPEDIIAEMKTLDIESALIMENLKLIIRNE